MCLALNCAQAGITECCTDIDRAGCGVQTSPNDTCYCDGNCFNRGDCCSDSIYLFCSPTPGNFRLYIGSREMLKYHCDAYVCSLCWLHIYVHISCNNIYVHFSLHYALDDLKLNM